MRSALAAAIPVLSSNVESMIPRVNPRKSAELITVLQAGLHEKSHSLDVDNWLRQFDYSDVIVACLKIFIMIVSPAKSLFEITD